MLLLPYKHHLHGRKKTIYNTLQIPYLQDGKVT